MRLQEILVQKVLEENYLPDETTKIEIPFKLMGKDYGLTTRHLNTIKTILKGEVNRKITFETEEFYIAGGSVLTLLMYGSPFLIKDIDIYPKTEADYLKIKEKLDAAAAISKDEIRENDNSRSYEFYPIKFDLVKKYFNNIDDCLASFDLNVVKVGFDHKYNFHKKVFIEDIFGFNMKLTQETKTTNAFTQLRRIMKYAEKGFRIPARTLMEITATLKSGQNKFSGEAADPFSSRALNPIWEENMKQVEEEVMKGYHDIVNNKPTDLEDLGF